MTESDLDELHRPRVREAALGDLRWTNADVPLLDELLHLVGGPLGGQSEEDRTRERDEVDEFERALAADELDQELAEESANAGQLDSDHGYGSTSQNEYAQAVLDSSEARASDHPDMIDRPGVLRLDDPQFDQFGRRSDGYWA